MTFLPTTIQEAKRYYQQFTSFDVIFITGDPYYDHPLNGTALLARLLDKKDYKVGIIPQPQTDADFSKLGKPKYFFCISSGLLDSMLANYTPMLKKREHIHVPEHAVITYTHTIKRLFKESTTVIGGVEATIRRFAHFDYVENKLRRGILNDSKADFLIFGNAERSLLNLLEALKNNNNNNNNNMKRIDGIALRVKKEDLPHNVRFLPSFEEQTADKTKFNLAARIQFLLPDDPFIEQTGQGYILHNRPGHPLNEEEMDYVYELPFTRKLHPATIEFNAIREIVEFLDYSVVLGRGCWGGCYFCVIPLVQGKNIARRSKEGIIKEIKQLQQKKVSKINDLTMPTLNMYGSYCAVYNVPEQIYSPILNQQITVYNKTQYCNQQCVGCKYRKLRDDLIPLLEDVEKLNINLELRSAIRHDIILDQKKLFRKIMQFVTRLKIAPEHIRDTVLKNMNKSNKKAFDEFLKEYELINREQHTHKKLVPYFVAAHPGCTEEDMKALKEYCKKNNIFIELTQVFTPTPGTVSTAMYYSGENPISREKVHVPRTFREKKDQKNILLTISNNTIQRFQRPHKPHEDDEDSLPQNDENG
ncbi:YgiQ family radical SAM protein [Candidatus Woesearchaeota archaeon]|nr:YgiQ family radical SAM protein [Candidatus Woesearchaeota archaeon]